MGSEGDGKPPRASTDELALTVPIDGGAQVKEPARFDTGDLIADRYRVIRLIGLGGMGYIYEVLDEELGDRVALKTVRPSVELEPEVVAQLKRETQLARRVTHANVSRIFDVGFHSADDVTTPFLTMELLRGETLSARLKRMGPMSTDEAMPIVEEVCAGLAAAHEAGVIHGDFKSSNVMLVPRDGASSPRAILMDFGLARTVGFDDLESTDEVIGSPAYISPEQLRGTPLTEAADIYSLGVVLYEMVTGHYPFSGGSASQVAMKRLREPPTDPTEYVPDLSEVWQRTLHRCLERDAENRFDSARAVFASLCGRDDVGLPPARSRRWWALAAVVALILGVAGIGLGVWGSSSSSSAESALPRSGEARRHYRKALGHLEAYDNRSALAELDAVIAVEPDFAFAHAARADVFVAVRRSRAAKAASKRSVELAADLPDRQKREIEARNFQTDGRHARAIEVLVRLVDEHPSYDLKLRLAILHGTEGELERSYELFRKLRARQPHSLRSARAAIEQAKVSGINDDYQTARRLAQEASETAAKLDKPHMHATAERMHAWALLNLGEFAAAETRAHRARKMFEAIDDRLGQALSLGYLGEIAKKRGRYATVLAIAEDKIQLYTQLGMGLPAGLSVVTKIEALAGMGKLNDALAEVDKTALPGFRKIESDYGEAVGRIIRCELNHDAGRLSAALQDCRFGETVSRVRRTSVRIAAWAHHQLGLVYLDMGKLEQAETTLRRALTVRKRLRLTTQAAQTRLGLARLTLARTKTQETTRAALTAAKVFESAGLATRQAQALALAGQAKLAAGDVDGAATLARRATTLLQGSDARKARLRVERLSAQVVAAETGDSEPLERVITAANAAGYVGIALAAELALCRAALARGPKPEISKRLAKLRERARQHGYQSIAANTAP